MDIGIILYIIIFLYGITIGSFLNVCIYRIPLKENIITRRSHCMKCGYQLKWYDLIPLISYLMYKGECRKCKEKISFQYPMVEASNGFFYVWVFFLYGISFISLIYCLAISALLVLSVIDFRTYEIPFGINVFLGVLGLVHAIYDREHFITYLLGFIGVSGFLFFLYLVTKGRGIGGGDIKLMAVSGLLLGWQNNLLAFILGCVIGSMIHIIRMRVSNQDRILAFGPYLSVGIIIAMLYGKPLIDWYLNAYL